MWQLLAAAGAQVAGGLLGSSAASKAAKAAAANEAANRALIEKQMQRADQYLGPYATGGLGSFNALQNLDGLVTDPSQPKQDWNAYLQANPDVMAWAQGGGGDPSKPIEQQSLAERAAYQYRNTGQAEGRQVPTTPGDPSGGTYGGYDAPRPTYTRSPYADSPSAPSLAVGDFKNSGYYNLGVDEGVNNVNQNAGARGLLKSGWALKGVTDYARAQQDKNYGDWANLELQKYDRQLNQFNADRSFNDTNFEQDRDFGTTGYESDRNYATDRFDTRVNDLFRMTGVGTDAATGIVGAGQTGTNALVNNNNTGLQNRTAASFAKTNALTGTLSNLASIYGAYGGGSGGAYGGNIPEANIPKSVGINNWSQYYG